MATKTKGGQLPGPGSARLPMPPEESCPDAAKDARGKALDGLESASQPPAATEAVEGHDNVPNAAPRHPEVDKAEFCLVLSPDGEYPTLEIFPDIESLAKRIRTVEDRDVVAFPFFGVPIPFASGPNRFLQLPNGQPYPVFDFTGYGKFVPDPTVTLPIDLTYSLRSNALHDESPKAAVVDHRPKVAEAGGGRGQRCRKTTAVAAGD